MRGGPEFTSVQVEHAVLEATGSRAGGAVHVPRGYANENWAVETTAGRVLCKISPPAAPVAKWRGSAHGLELARGVGVPVPRLLAFHESCKTLGGRLVRVFEFVEGLHPDELCDADKQLRLWGEVGEAVARLHEVALPAFSSRLDPSAPAFPTWHAYVAYRVPQIHRRALATGAFEEEALERLWKPLLDLASRVAPEVRPTLVHRDIYPDNLVAREDGSLAAIVDFDMAEAWDPVADFPKLRWWAFEETTGAEAAFLATYRARIPHHAQFDERLTVVEVLELVNQIANAPAADDPFALRARERLRATALG